MLWDPGLDPTTRSAAVLRPEERLGGPAELHRDHRRALVALVSEVFNWWIRRTIPHLDSGLKWSQSWQFAGS